MHVNAETAFEVGFCGGARFEPDLVLPGQLPGGSPSTQMVGEKRLMLAVLEEAVATFQRYVHAQSRRGRRLFAETLEWFASDDLGWPFTFVNLCHGLGFDVDYLRMGLRRWRDRMQSTTEPTRFAFRRVSGRRLSVSGRPLGIAR